MGTPFYIPLFYNNEINYSQHLSPGNPRGTSRASKSNCVNVSREFHMVQLRRRIDRLNRQPNNLLLSCRMVRLIADEFLTEERDRKYHADHYTCCPPPLFILIITLIEVSVTNSSRNPDVQPTRTRLYVRTEHDLSVETQNHCPKMKICK